MPLAERLRSIFELNQIPYNLSRHRPALRASEVAYAEHLPAWEVAKTVVVVGNNKYHLIVVASDRQVNLHEVEAALDIDHVRLATEAELADLFPDCELGAMPPIGLMYDLPVYLDSDLANESILTFNAGSHQECVHMLMTDFQNWTKPKVVALARLQMAAHGG
jgi:Ala-tRNA(Pro) deacylase